MILMLKCAATVVLLSACVVSTRWWFMRPCPDDLKPAYALIGAAGFMIWVYVIVLFIWG
jgi:hypothetical protein